MQNKNFTLEEFETSLVVVYKGITVSIDTTKDNARTKAEILDLIESNKKTYSCMCTNTGMPFSHIEGFSIIECINRNLIALEKLDKLDDFRNKYSKKENEYDVYLQKIM